MKRVYPVIFTETNDEKKTVLIEVPDLHIFSEGYGIQDAFFMARDAIGISGICKEDNGEDIPEASAISDIDIEKSEFADEGNSFVSLVDIDFSAYRRSIDDKTVRRNVTIPNWLNEEAKKAHLNVSKVLTEALMTKLNVYSK